MDILYSSSDSYSFLTGISILSLLENNQNVDRIHIYIMDNHITQENKEKLRQVVCQYGREITFVEMPDMVAKTGLHIDTRRWNISTFGRLYMASVLPETVHKVLNIDCDTIVLDSLEPLWNTDMTGRIVGGMQECINDRYRRNIGMQDGDLYINGGLIFLNLDEVRARDYEVVFTDYIKTYGDALAYLDQDVINATVPQTEKQCLPLRYNMLSPYFYVPYEQMKQMRRARNFCTKEEFVSAKLHPAVIHFTTCYLDGLRPWIRGNRHPYLGEFLRYKAASPWAELPLQADNRRITAKLCTKLIRCTPKKLLLPVAAILHGVIVPERNKRKMDKMRDRTHAKI